jgi:predicted nucleic acid-binding protein
LYAVSTATSERLKSRIAREVLDRNDLALSVQVLQEFYVQATHGKRRDRLTHNQAVLLIESFLRFPVQENTAELLISGAALADRHRISYWDAAVIEAARSLGCDTVISEDLNDGQNYDGIAVVNPFRGSALGIPH